MPDLASLQPLPLGLVLVWAAYGKLLDSNATAKAGRTALPRLVGDRHAPRAYRATGVVELVVGAMLLTPGSSWVEAVAAAGLTVSFLGYLMYARLIAPDSSCGCVGSAAAPVSGRSITRAAVLLVAASAIALANAAWTGPIADQPIAATILVAAELTLFVVLSPELDRWWLTPLRRWRVRLTHPLAGATSGTPLESTVQRLVRSPAYESVGDLIRSDIRDFWDEDGWRFVSYTAAFTDRSALAVFAVPLSHGEPGTIRVAIVDEDSGETLHHSVDAPS